MRPFWLGLIAVLAIWTPVLADGEPLYEARWVEVVVSPGLPDDLSTPESRTRWEWSDLETGAGWRRSVRPVSGDETGLEVTERRTTAGQDVSSIRSYRDLAGSNGAERWLMPQRDEGADGTGRISPLRLLESSGGAADELMIQSRRVGSGWIFLPSGAHEVFLQRALVLRKAAGSSGFVPDKLVHRWVDRSAGVVAEVWGPVSSDGKRRLEIAGAAYAEDVTQRGPALKIFADEIDRPVFTRLNYGWDRGNGVAVSSLTPAAPTTIGDLALGASSWDFSGNNQSNSTSEIASTNVPVAGGTCSENECGFTAPGTILGREDRNWDDPPNREIILSAAQREDRPTDTTIWLRAGIFKEGEAGALGDGESRFCFTGTDGSGNPREEVPLWRFSHQDGAGQPFYMQNGDSWANAPWNCENDFFNHVCPNSCGFLCPIYAGPCGDHTSTQYTDVINEGPVTLPSGHTFNSLVVRQVTDFCAYLGNSCGLDVDRVRTVIYFWLTPNLGTIVRLQSVRFESDVSSFTTLEQTDIKFGLFPPRSITATNITDTTVEISWDPGLDTHRIDGYRVYWDTDSGGDSNYAFNSVSNPGQVTINGTTAVISGLAAGTDYFVTVTSLSDYTDPSSGLLTTYESLLYPTVVPGAPAPVPAEIVASTTGGTCTPTTEVDGVTGSRLAGGDVEFCWSPTVDPCLDGYQIIGADQPESDLGFSVLVPDTGLVTCQTLGPTQSYFLVLASGTGGTGPWGHYGN